MTQPVTELRLVVIVLQLARECLDEAAKVVKVGVTADEIDRVVHEVSNF